MVLLFLSGADGLRFASPFKNLKEPKMENINPAWRITSHLQYQLSAGHSVRQALLIVCRSLETPIDESLFKWAQQFPCPPPSHEGWSFLRVQLLKIIEDGLKGRPIYESLTQLELEILESLSSEIDEHIAKLPFLSLFPMLFFIGPSLFLMLIGPLLSSLLKELSS